MKRVLRTMAAAVLAIGGVVGVTSAASAVDPPANGCEDQGDDYFGGGVCQSVVEATAVCVDDVPYLDYTAVLEGTTASELTVTWLNPAGESVVLTNQPLTGRLLWPGVELGPDGVPTDYPGWVRNADGTWTPGDSMGWVAGSVDVNFKANPEATATVQYPGADGCIPGGAVTQVSSGGGAASGGGVLGHSVTAAELSETGFSAVPLAGAAGGLVLAGALLLLVTRLRGPHEER
ncbi:peptidase [Cellulomonas sp. APG4]|uniref:peptidase n=1 Tax=Cellulomonas sp. APG4 TaxID=1538656 RepID=UPI00137ACEA7|nr:peptidase [Cellulomonas sp. APG4]NCT90551.1 peptidase [Cellulomonas sp. APG4]